MAPTIAQDRSAPPSPLLFTAAPALALAAKAFGLLACSAQKCRQTGASLPIAGSNAAAVQPGFALVTTAM